MTPATGTANLAVVEGFECPYDHRSYVVGGCLPLVGSPKANWSWVRGQTKHSSKTSMGGKTKSRTCVPSPEGSRHPAMEAGLGKGFVSEHLVLGPLSMGSGRAQETRKHGSILMWAHHPQLFSSSSFQEGGQECVFQLPWYHTPQPPWEGLLQGAGEESTAASWPSDSTGAIWFFQKVITCFTCFAIEKLQK